MRKKIKDTSFLVISFGKRLYRPPHPSLGVGNFGGGAPPGSLNLNPTSDQTKKPFSHPFSDLAFKIRTRT